MHRSAPSVRRVVVTSSFAAVLTETLLDDPATTFSEASLNPSTLADVHSSPATAYRVSKTLAERAAWDFAAAECGPMELATVLPVAVMGPAWMAWMSLATRQILSVSRLANDLRLGRSSAPPPFPGLMCPAA